MRQRKCGAARAGMAVAAMAVWCGAAAAGAPGSAVVFAPHRAIYDITLERATSGSGVVELAGRMIYELQGSRCEGYTQNMRFVTRIISQDGSEQLNDLRTSSWEEGFGRRLRFNSEQYRDQKLVEATAGDARRRPDGGDIEAEIAKPERKQARIPFRYLFPMQHSEALLNAARHGARQLAVGIYDGSEKGTKAYETSAFIGVPRTTVAADEPPGLAGIPSWPVAIAYFEPGGAAGDAVPSYELSFRLFANGVSTGMVIDYGEFAVRGELTDLKFYPPTRCQEQPAVPAAPAAGGMR